MALQLRVPTNQTVQGPKIKMAHGKLIVDYDFENDDGSVAWGQIFFQEVLSFEYRNNSCCPAESVLSSQEVRRLDQSRYLASVTALWEEFCGQDDWQQEQGGAQRFKHFSVYFDDAGCLDVIASGCDVGG